MTKKREFNPELGMKVELNEIHFASLTFGNSRAVLVHRRIVSHGRTNQIRGFGIFRALVVHWRIVSHGRTNQIRGFAINQVRQFSTNYLYCAPKGTQSATSVVKIKGIVEKKLGLTFAKRFECRSKLSTTRDEGLTAGSDEGANEGLRRRANARNVSTPFFSYGGITYLINSFDYPNLLCINHKVDKGN